MGGLDLKREIIDAHELINHVIAICDDDFRRAGIELLLELAAGSHHVDADPIRFQQALWNLIKNAIKFTPAGGRVTVRTYEREIELGRQRRHPGRSSQRYRHRHRSRA